MTPLLVLWRWPPHCSLPAVFAYPKPRRSPVSDLITHVNDDAFEQQVLKVNIDQNQQTPRAYGVRGIPTLMVFKNGKVEATQIGAVSKGQLTQMIDKAI